MSRAERAIPAEKPRNDSTCADPWILQQRPDLQPPDAVPRHPIQPHRTGPVRQNPSPNRRHSTACSDAAERAPDDSERHTPRSSRPTEIELRKAAQRGETPAATPPAP